MSFAFEPAVPASGLLRRASWSELDARLEKLLGRPAVAVPSVRVGILWILEHLGARRHGSELLVPRYLSRCVLNAVEGAAHPVYERGKNAAAALLVHNFGRRPDAASELAALEGLPLIEDSSDALLKTEAPAAGTLGKFIALSKLLPLIKGGCFLSERGDISDMLRRRRAEERPVVSWLIAAALLRNRSGRRSEGAAAVEAAYALYPFSPGDNAHLRGGFLSALERVDDISEVETRRFHELNRILGNAVLAPADCRLLRAAPLPADDDIRSVLGACGFDEGVLHVDLASSLARPRFTRACLVPLHPGVPDAAFTRLLEGLAKLPARKGLHDSAAL